MAFASLEAFIQAGIQEVSAGLPVGETTLWGQQLRIKPLADEALHKLAQLVAKDTAKRHLLMKTTTCALNGSGVGTLDTTLLTEWLTEGRVSDPDGNTLYWVPYYSKFLTPSTNVFGAYNLHNNQIRAKSPGSNDLLLSVNLTIDAPYVPAATEVPAEIMDDAIAILADLIRLRVAGVVKKDDKAV